jgi:acyl carrier protein
MADQDAVLRTIRSFVERCHKDGDFDVQATLYAEGIGLDSLETAELSAVLEDEFGSDPFSAGEVPQTVAEILDFYATAS